MDGWIADAIEGCGIFIVFGNYITQLSASSLLHNGKKYDTDILVRRPVASAHQRQLSLLLQQKEEVEVDVAYSI